jgi:hypothetical protein
VVCAVDENSVGAAARLPSNRTGGRRIRSTVMVAGSTMTHTKTKILIGLDISVLEVLDRERGLVTRSAYVNDVLRRHLKILPSEGQPA